jgi:hypothetical protein
MKATSRKANYLREELKELTETLHRLETLEVDAGTAIVYRFIGERISEIAKHLCDLIEENRKGLYWHPSSKLQRFNEH